MTLSTFRMKFLEADRKNVRKILVHRIYYRVALFIQQTNVEKRAFIL